MIKLSEYLDPIVIQRDAQKYVEEWIADPKNHLTETEINETFKRFINGDRHI
jgi:hypothetical protein